MTIIPQSLNYYADGVRRYAGSVTWGPLVQLSRSAILSTLSKITVGQLKVIEADGHTTICGELGANIKGPATELRVHKETFWVRMLLFADMGFAESYMLAEASCPSLTDFFTLFLLNRTALSNGTTLTSTLSSSLTFLASRTNTLANARLHISAHYDISNAMFAAFLSRDMTYSCPIWLPKSDPKHEAETLEDAQMTKLQRFIDRAHIKSTDHVLEIGTGWGSFAIRAVQQTGCRVTSLTLSTEQKSLAEERIAAAGLTERIEVLLCDYRALPIPKEGGRYDKIVSIEMLEAVGKEFLETYFACVDKLLKEEGGIACFQCITMPETRYATYASSTDFIRKYIFPGGHLPTISLLTSSLSPKKSSTSLPISTPFTSSSTHPANLIIDSIENIGPHYAKCLRLWNANFQANFNASIKPALLKEHVGMTASDVELFRRKWEYYFTYCEAGFKEGVLGDVIMTVAREGTRELGEDVPM